MLIIDKTKPLSPILEYKPKPDFKNDLEKANYWAKQKDLWINGLGEIPGTLVHKTQEQKIKHRNTGEMLRPTCRDVDLFVHQEIKKSREAEEALVIIKGRGIGLSSDFGCLGNYFMRVYPGSTSLFTSSDQAKISSLFSDKVMTTFNEYDTDIRPIIERKNETKNTSFLRAEIKSKNKEGKEYLAYSEIYCKETADNDANASGFSGKGCIFGGYDELFLHKRRNLLLKSSSSCFIEQETGKAIAFLLAGGTVEETLRREELEQLKTLIEDVQKSRRLGTLPARLLFIPAWWGKFMTNGHSDEKKAREWHEKEIEALSKLEDTTALRAFKMNNPMSLDDIFELSSGGRWEESTLETIKTIKADIQNSDISCEKHTLVYFNNKVEAKQSNKGSIWILEPPKPGCTYISCVDGVASDTDTGGAEGSDLAATIVKIFDPSSDPYMPVSIHSERPKTIEGAYEKIVNQAKYYNMFGGFLKFYAEANAATASHFGNYLIQNNLKNWIAMRRDLSGKGWVDQKKMFQYRTPELIDFQYKQANIFIRKYPNSIKMMPLIDQMLLPKSANADILDSWLQFFTAVTDFGQVKKEKPKPKPQETLTIEFVNGVSRWKKIQL